MKFLIDAQLPPALCSWLEQRGNVAEHVFGIGMVNASDDEIAKHAQDSESILISKDDDFVTLRLPDRFCLIWLRCGNSTNRALLAWLEPRWDQIELWLTKGERFIEVR